MCLLAVAFQTHDNFPLIVAANRDELLARPARSMTMLQESGPRIVGGQDLLALGTWLAINESGVFAALTNQFAPPSAAKRSRGEIPLFAAQHSTAERAVQEIEQRIAPKEFRPCWLLIGDPKALFYADLTAEAPQIIQLKPGVHVIENVALGAPSAKVDLIKIKFEAALKSTTHDDYSALQAMLSSHDQPPNLAACVHAGPYGTRSSTIVLQSEKRIERIAASEAAPCQSSYVDVTRLMQQ